MCENNNHASDQGYARHLFLVWQTLLIFFLAASTILSALATETGDNLEVTEQMQVDASGPAKLLRESDTGVVLVLEEESGSTMVTFDLQAEPLDLADFVYLSVRLDNHSDATLDVRISGEGEQAGKWPVRLNGRFILRSGEQDALLNVLVTRPALPRDHPLVKTFGNLYGLPGGHHRHWDYVKNDLFTRVRVKVEWANASREQRIHISRPFGTGAYTSDPAILDGFDFPVVDTFGQLRWQNWEGKVASEEELRVDAEKDLARAAKFTDFGPQRSRFGGYKGAARHDASGFFRVEKIDGRWWFIDPGGHLFWSIGANTMAGGIVTEVSGRESLFPEGLSGQVNFHHQNLIRKYGETDWVSQHVDVTVGRMKEWGLNTVGAWARRALFETGQVPFTIQLHPFTTWVGPIRGMVDPFDPHFKESLEQQLSRFAETHAENPWLVGIFIHNELPWNNGIALGEAIINSPEGLPARKAALAHLRERYESIADLNEAWGTGFTDFEVIQAQDSSNPEYTADITAIMEQFAEAYFRISRHAMRQHFPNHLYLGCRFHTRNPIITRIASRYMDVISVNYYEYGLSEFRLETEVSRPILIGEFHFGVPDFGHWGQGLRMAADARNQADLMRTYFHEALRHPDMVGAHWFAWADQPVTGRYDGENFGIGLVSISDRPHQLRVQTLREISEKAYQIRRSGVDQPTSPPESTLP